MALTTFRHNANSITSKYAPACVCASLPQGSESGKSFAPGAFCVMENEIWLPVKGFEGHYEVSNTGIVNSLKRGGRKRIYIGFNQKGYAQVGLSKNGVSKTYKLHRVVAEAFIPNPHSLPQVNHINGVKDDNRPENLEWVTAKANTEHGIKVLGYRHGARMYVISGRDPVTQTVASEYFGLSNVGFRKKYLRNPLSFNEPVVEVIIQSKYKITQW